MSNGIGNSNSITPRATLACAAAAVVLALAPAAHAASGGAPTVNGLDQSSNGTIANSQAEGVAGATGGGGGRVRVGPVDIGGSGSRSTGTLQASIEAGISSVNGDANVSNTRQSALGVVASSLAKGALLKAGVSSIGP